MHRLPDHTFIFMPITGSEKRKLETKGENKSIGRRNFTDCLAERVSYYSPFLLYLQLCSDRSEHHAHIRVGGLQENLTVAKEQGVEDHPFIFRDCDATKRLTAFVNLPQSVAVQLVRYSQKPRKCSIRY